MANMLGLFMMPIVQDQNMLRTYAIACDILLICTISGKPLSYQEGASGERQRL